MGDRIENIHGSVIATRGGRATVVRSGQLNTELNRIGRSHGADAEDALSQIMAHLARHPQPDADRFFETFVQEASKPEPDRSHLKTLWNEFKSVLPHADAVASAVRTIATLFL